MKCRTYLATLLISMFATAHSAMPSFLEDYQAELGEYYDFLHAGLSYIDDGNPKVIVESSCVTTSDFLESCSEGATSYIFGQYILENGGKLFVSDINSTSVARARKGYRNLFNATPDNFTDCEVIETLATFPSCLVDLAYFAIAEDSFKAQYQSLKQLTAVLKRISENAVILIDFRFPAGEKPPLIERYLNARGWESLTVGQKKAFVHKIAEN